MTEKKERTCIICKRILVDEKIPVCDCCQNKVAQGATGIAAAVLFKYGPNIAKKVLGLLKK